MSANLMRVIARDNSDTLDLAFAFPEQRYHDLRHSVLRMVAPNCLPNPYTGKRIGDHADADVSATDFLVSQLARCEHDAVRAKARRGGAQDSTLPAADHYVRDDSTGAYYLQSQLARVESTMIDVLYKPTAYSKLLPVVVGSGLMYDSVRYQTSDRRGVAKEISQSSDAIPTAEVATGVNDIAVTDPVAIAYKWGVLELAQSAYLRKPIDAQKAVAAREAFERAMNSAALFGQLNPAGLTPTFPCLFVNKYLTNNTLTTKSFVTAITGAWGGVNSTSTTAQQILNDVNKLLLQVWIDSGYNDWPTDLLLPTTCLSPFVQIVSTAGNRSILDYLKENNAATVATGAPLSIRFEPGLEDTSLFDSSTSAGNRRAVAYVRDAGALEFEVTQPLSFLAPQYENLFVTVPGYGRCTRGVKFKRPTHINWMDNV